MLVSNSSTLILMAKATLLSKFLDLVGDIAITNVIHGEVLKKDSFENLIIKKEIGNGRIKVKSVTEKFYLNVLKQFKLDEGEASAFALCTKGKGKAVLTDDKELIKLCRIEGVKFISAMSVAVILFKKKIINKNEALEKIENLQSYGRYSSDVYNYFKSRVR